MKGRAKEQKGIEYYMDLPYSILLHEVDDEGEKYWIAEVPELPGCNSHGSSVEEAVKSVEEAKKDWILDSLESKEEVPTPVDRDRYSGRMLVRMSRSLHRSLALIAEFEGLSLNQLIVTMLAKEAGRLSVLNRVEDKVDDLLQKIDRVLEEERVRIPFLESISETGLSKKQKQHIIFDTEQVLGYLGTAADAGLIGPGVVTTGSPFEDIWHYQHHFQYPEQQPVVYSVKKVGKEGQVTTEHK